MQPERNIKLTIIAQNLTKIYGTQKAVDHISFRIEKGEVVGFLGPNGAGKSTTMKILACYTLPTEGHAMISGYNIITQNLLVRKHIGYLPEQNPLYNDMYIKEYLLFLSKLHQLGKNANSRVEEMIEMTGLTPEQHKKIGQLSKGYKQRVGLAQALIHNPDVLLLDEPTSGLDPNQIIEIRNLIKTIGKTKTIILSSHILQEVQAMCNRIIIINAGKIVADDTTDNLINSQKQRITVQVEFKNTVSKQQLLSIDGVIKADFNQPKWFIVSEKPDIREKLFEFAVNSGNNILEMTKDNLNLEQIFQQLTVN